MSGTPDLYNNNSFSVQNIINNVDQGFWAVPEIQRPFVWDSTQVRDLIDSLYRGYPTGFIVTWQNSEANIKEGGKAKYSTLIIDGQQRIISLLAALKGAEVMDQSYHKKFIKIAFNPLAVEDEEKFAVQSAAHIKDPKWIEDISVLFKSDFDPWTYVDEYCERNPGVKQSVVGNAISALRKIMDRQIGHQTLSSALDVPQVSDIFVRINSKGTQLNEADFAMSRLASDEARKGHIIRRAVDFFCHTAEKPEFLADICKQDKVFAECQFSKQMEWVAKKKLDIYVPQYSDVLRVVYMHKFHRAKLKDLVSKLAGRDFGQRSFTSEEADKSFKMMEEGVQDFISESNYTKFIEILKTAGYASPRIIRATLSLDFAYTLFLILKDSGEMADMNEIAKYVKKWFALSQLTGRYTASAETKMEADLKRIDEIGVKALLNEMELGLGDSFWNANALTQLTTSSKAASFYVAYLAAQINGGDKVLLSRSASLASVIDTLEVHHIFPKQYLINNGFNNKVAYNQIANFAYVEDTTNKLIGKSAPADYFSQALLGANKGSTNIGTIVNKWEFEKNLADNCIPQEIFDMSAKDYPEFLNLRRKLMAKKIKAWYDHL